MTTATPALLTIAHGTRDPRGAEEMDVLLEHLRGRIDAPVANAWLEDFSEPDPSPPPARWSTRAPSGS
jgi:sirohydrochlorin ferrochelatase